VVQYPLTLRNTALSQTSLLPKRGVFALLFDAMMTSRRRRAVREIELYLGATGSPSRLTDNIEREIEHRVLSNRSWR